MTLIGGLVLGLLVAGAVVLPPAFSTPLDEKVRICHATSSHSNPYNSIEPAIANNDDLKGGHLDHTGPIYPAEGWGDIIPPYEYRDAQDQEQTFPAPTGRLRDKPSGRTAVSHRPSCSRGRLRPSRASSLARAVASSRTSATRTRTLRPSRTPPTTCSCRVRRTACSRRRSTRERSRMRSRSSRTVDPSPGT